MTDEARLPDPETALRNLPQGAAIIFRNYNSPNREELAVKIKTACLQRGLKLFIAGDWRLAAKIKANGLHLPAYMAAAGASPGARIWQKYSRAFLTIAAHKDSGLRSARLLKADAVIMSPVFPTKSHPDRKAIGPLRFAAIVHKESVRKAGLKVIALGGVSKQNFNALNKTGCAGIAGIGFAT